MNRSTLMAGALCAVVLCTAAMGQSIRVGPFLQDASPTNIWIAWETTSGDDGTVYYGTNPRVLSQSATGLVIPSQGPHRIHHVELPDLEPDTAYWYQVETGTALSDVFYFRTPPLASKEQPFRFAVLSDTQGGPVSNMHTQVINDGIIDFITDNYGPDLARNLAFVLQPGDLVSTGTNYAQWKTQYFDEAQNLYQHVPVYPVAGNHEQDAEWYFRYFKLPENGTPGFIEHWWYKDHGNVRIIGLDTNGAYRVPEQLDWLVQTLDDAATKPHIDFVFAQFHHPALSEAWTPGNTNYSEQIIERLEAFTERTGKPSAHLFGHTHAYSRGQSQEHAHLWVNVASGEGGIDWWGAFPNKDYHEFARTFVDHGFVLIDVEAGGDPKFRLRRVSRGNAVAPKDNEIMDDIELRMFNDMPQTPTPAFPSMTDGPQNPDIVTLQASPFVDPDGDDHWESQFQLTTVSGDYSDAAVVASDWIRFENWYRPEGATGQANGYFSVNTVTDPDVTKHTLDDLEANMTYFWRVRYRDSGLAWSEWSGEMEFTTGDAIVGACCLPIGGCTDEREQRCLDQGGDWQGEGTSCADSPCPEIITFYTEDFEGVALGEPVDEPGSGDVWSATAPAGWSVDRTQMPSGGVTEWRGWTFASKDFWIDVAGDQGRSEFVDGLGTVAIADPDEWHDAPKDPGTFTSSMATPEIAIDGARAGTLRLVANSAWAAEGSQRARLTVSYDGAAPETVFTWESQAGDNFKPTDINELLDVNLNNPAGARSMVLTFHLEDAGNNWYWAVDNVRVIGEPSAPRTQAFFEGFDDLPLGPSVDEPLAASDVWTDIGPTGWTVDDSGVPGVDDPAVGMTEWEGWAFTDPDWWTTIAVDQNRSQFARGFDTIAVADPDEWDDRGNAASLGAYNAWLRTPAIVIDTLTPDTIELSFDSSWRPEDDQRAVVDASFDRGGTQRLIEWTSTSGSAFKPDATNERVTIPVSPPAGATEMTVSFGLLDARNDWWWAIDNVLVTGACRIDLAGPADPLSPDGQLTGSDFFAFLAMFTAGDLTVDLASPADPALPDGLLTGSDFFRFLELFQRGCS